MKDYWFRDAESGDEFFVECETDDEAWTIIEKNCLSGELEIIDVIEPWEAERMALDTYPC